MPQAGTGDAVADAPRRTRDLLLDAPALRSLLAGCVSRDESAWRQFLRAYHPLIAGTAARLLPGERTDLVQQVYLRLVEDEARLLARFTGGEAAFLVYLQRIVRNVACEMQGRLRRAPVSACDPLAFAETLADERGNPDGPLATAETLERFAEMIAALGPKYREVLLLLARGWKHREIAALLGIPLPTCLTRSKRAKEKLRGQLALAAGRERRKTDA